VEVESLQAEVAELSSKLDKVVKEKSAATERLAVVEAEYRTYKKVCETCRPAEQARLPRG
jgi:outer membrane murein-binding lipoprotein Lpp